MSVPPKPRLGVSACLLGREVRYDGGHKKNDFLTVTLAAHVEFVPVCPEVESGMPVPRESVRLVAAPEARMIGNQSGSDYTDSMRSYAKKKVAALKTGHLDGFVFKKNSPSCGLERVRIEGGAAGAGLFAETLRAAWPTLPLTEEGWLFDNERRHSFLARLFFHHRFANDVNSRGELVDFHARYKYLFLAHSPARYRELGRMVATVSDQPLDVALTKYLETALSALSVKTSRGKHANVLQHMVGFFKDVLTADEKQEAIEVITDYRAGVSPLSAPLTLLSHHLRKHQQSDWLAHQVYFQPYPKGLTGT
jgi:uncharacterized protein YbgA (DUF1722 family)/uncharacterized protein YbbK (DUF523 family)